MRKKFTPPDETPAFAKLLGSRTKVSASFASELAAGKKRPSLEKAVEFERVYGIPCAFWIGWGA